MVREWSDRIAAVAAIAMSGWLFTSGAVAALSASAVLVGRRPGQTSILVLIQLVLGVIVVTAAITVGRAVPRIWTGGTYRRRTVALIALVTTLFAAVGILVTQQAGLIAIVVPSLALLRLSSRPPACLTRYQTEPQTRNVDQGGVG